MRKVIVSAQVTSQLSDLKNYLKNELKLSQQAALEHNNRFLEYINSLSAEVDHPLCRFKRWRRLGYRCAVFEKQWVLAYQIVQEGVIVRDLTNTALLIE